LNDLELKIIIRLRNHHRGKDNAIHYKELAIDLGINERELRDIVSNLVIDGKACIGSNCTEGYFYIVTDEEYQHTRNEIMSRIKKLAKRAKGLRLSRMFDKQLEEPKQLNLLGV